jgi:hypothetical protein
MFQSTKKEDICKICNCLIRLDKYGFETFLMEEYKCCYNCACIKTQEANDKYLKEKRIYFNNKVKENPEFINDILFKLIVDKYPSMLDD